MSPRRLLLTLLPVLLTTAAGVRIWQSHVSAAGPSAAPVLPDPGPNAKPKIVSGPTPGGPRQFSPKPPPKSAATPGTDHPQPDPANGPATTAAARSFEPISEQELQRRAALVEQEANHDLKHLVALLDLSESQQDRIFDSLVRHAPGWHPAMQSVGANGPAPSPANPPGAANSTATSAPTSAAEPGPAASPALLDEIAATLEPEQQVELANSELDRQEWWEEIIPRLLAATDPPAFDVTTGTGTAAAAPPPAETPTAEEPAVLAE